MRSFQPDDLVNVLSHPRFHQGVLHILVDYRKLEGSHLRDRLLVEDGKLVTAFTCDPESGKIVDTTGRFLSDYKGKTVLDYLNISLCFVGHETVEGVTVVIYREHPHAHATVSLEVTTQTESALA
jgi:hypothetical protein